LSLGVTEHPLWKGREPAAISILKGTNIEARGAWNEEDELLSSKYDFDYEAVDKAAKKLIRERLTSTPPAVLLKFYVDKFTD
jgi:hypothetical protein